MKLRHSLIATGVAAVVLAGAAFANPNHDRRSAKMDTDGDGQVEVTEIEAQAAKRAAEIDANADGRIVVAEIRAHREKMRAEREEARLLRLDTNGDGTVSTVEFASGHASRAAKMDKNGDGIIAKDEFGHRRHGRRGGHHAAD